ncbi:unnamed protein product [Periconia digitata]|uniref:Palmitoyltransferase PFA4 n=1 Tax=Periconia digitata TaxID=1303443 RepID=A0A9W4XHZ1_9PLEO|nr:unnamed protein product [Periconia digitata]
MELNRLAVPAVYVLIAFLGYPSQVLFYYLEPRPLTKNELILANVLLVCIFITYTKSVYVDPGTIPKNGGEELSKEQGESSGDVLETKRKGAGQSRTKWCRKCDAVKPPRAHHCKECKRCIPKMDHHCPWTANCVSHTTFPHFLRFLLYTTLGLTLLTTLLTQRLHHLWTQRDLPSYLGPSKFLVFHLFATTLVNSITFFALSVLLIRNIWSLAVNTTTIEGWEIARHRTVLRRARVFGGFLDTPNGARLRITKQEFPYDIGVWRNVVQGMGGSANPLNWFNPLSPTPPLETGLAFPTNGFEDPDVAWPPPDPDRSFVRRETVPRGGAGEADGEGGAFVYGSSVQTPQQTLAAFRARQHADIVRRRKPFVQRVDAAQAASAMSSSAYRDNTRGDDEGDDGSEEGFPGSDDEVERGSNSGRGAGKYGAAEDDGEEAWRNAEGERLLDFGVDEEVEFYDEPVVVTGEGEDGGDDDDVPLSELLSRKRREMGRM